MNNKVSATIENYNMIKNGQSVAVALSGGADSVALLHCLCALSRKMNFSVSAAHFNHGIRGEEAKRDENFCRAFCQDMGVELVVGYGDVPAIAKETGESIELCARRMRYDYLESLGVDLIATAHTATDTAETMIFNLARGGGIKGMAGIPAKRGKIIRPMIEITRQEVEDYCAQHNLSFVTDSTNLSDDYTRNNIRHHVSPKLREINSAFEKNAAHTASLLRSDADFLEKAAHNEYERLVRDDRLSLEVAKVHPSLSGRVVARFIDEQVGTSHDSCHIEAVARMIQRGSGTVQLKCNMEARAARGWLWVAGRSSCEDFCLELKSGVNVVPGYEIIVEFLANEEIKEAHNVHKMLLNGSIDCDKIVGVPIIRNRRDGDTFCPNGRGVTKTLKNLFAEQDIPAEKRGEIPMIADEKGIVWIPGQKPAKRVAATKESKNIIFIKDCKPI